MKTFGGLFDRLVSRANLWRAWREFRRGKRDRPSVRAFELDAEREVLRLHRELGAADYRCGEYRLMASTLARIDPALFARTDPPQHLSHVRLED